MSQRMTNAAMVTEKKSNKQVCTTTKFIIGGIVCFHDDQQAKNLVPGNISSDTVCNCDWLWYPIAFASELSSYNSQ